jgi:hypothetical protein
MSDQSTVETRQRGTAGDAAIEAGICLDKANEGDGPEKPSEGAAERVRMQAEVARDIAAFLAEETLR